MELINSNQHQQYLKIREVLNLKPGEKRVNPRHDIYMLVKYRTTQANRFDDGILCNLSQEGALFYTLGDLGMNDNVHMMIFPDENTERPIEVTAEVVRREANDGTYNSFNYGCRIKTIEDPNLDLSICANSDSAEQ